MAKYELISKEEVLLLQENCPFLILGYALTKDNEKNQVLAQIKFKNFDKRNVQAVYISIEGWNIDSTKSENIQDVMLDLDIPYLGEFGSDKPIYFSDNTIRKYLVRVEKIIFKNEEIWKPENENCKFTESIKFDEITLTSEEKEQVQCELRKSFLFVERYYLSKNVGNYRMCSCGAVNRKDEVVCYKCGQTQEWWDKLLDRNRLKENIESYKKQLEEEKQQEIERRAAFIIKVKKIVPISIVVILITGALWYLIDSIIVPSQMYKKAAVCVENGEYAEAINYYTELGDYKDSNEKLSQVSEEKEKEDAYSLAYQYYQDKEYENAISTFESVIDMKDAAFYSAEAYFALEDYENAILNYQKVSKRSTNRKEADKKESLSNFYLGVSKASIGELDPASEYFKLSKESDAEKYLDVIDKIKKDNWIGVYKREIKDNETEYWMQIVACIKEDLTYEYEVYDQTSMTEYFYTKLSVDKDGKLLLLDEVNHINMDNCGERTISSSTHKFQPDESVYEKKGGTSGGTFWLNGVWRVYEKISLSKQDNQIIMDRHIHRVELTKNIEEDKDYQYRYVKQ